MRPAVAAGGFDANWKTQKWDNRQILGKVCYSQQADTNWAHVGQKCNDAKSEYE